MPRRTRVPQKAGVLVDIQLLHESRAGRFAVFTLMPSSDGTSFVDFPSAINWSTCRSRAVNGSLVFFRF
jgi:hypothetical protein